MKDAGSFTVTLFFFIDIYVYGKVTASRAVCFLLNTTPSEHGHEAFDSYIKRTTSVTQNCCRCRLLPLLLDEVMGAENSNKASTPPPTILKFYSVTSLGKCPCWGFPLLFARKVFFLKKDKTNGRCENFFIDCFSASVLMRRACSILVMCR